MGNKNQTASKSVRNQYQCQYNPPDSGNHKHKQFELNNHPNHQKENIKKNSIKRHLSSSNRNLVNRSSSSPVIANKWRLNQTDESDKCNQFEEICTLTRFRFRVEEICYNLVLNSIVLTQVASNIEIE